LWDKNDSSSISGRGQLQQQTLGETTIDSRVFRTISDTPVDWQSQRGWFMDLTVGSAGNGERVLGRPRVLLGNVVFTTYLPQGDICNPGGVSRAYVVDLLTGAPDGNIAGGSCSNCGGAVIAVEGAPVASPPVAVRPPSDGAREGIDRPVQDRDGSGNLVNPTPAPGCRNDIGLILGEGYARLKEIDCGRQAWRQLQ
jgi:type IV pilus assembly protein PilY1